MTDDTWFDLASLTKVIFTTPRILALAETGRIDLDAPLVTVLPDFRQYNADNWERKVTFRQCLRHLTPFPAVIPIYTYGRDPDLLRAFVLQHEWQAGPTVYSDINYILLGLVLERLEHKTIRDMDPGPGFAWSADPEKAAATEDDTWRHRVLCGEVHDDNCSALTGSGHAGLFGTAASILDFAQGCCNIPASPAARSTSCAGRSQRAPHAWLGTSTKAGRAASAARPKPSVTPASPAPACGSISTAAALWTLLTNRIHPTRHFDSGIVARCAARWAT